MATLSELLQGLSERLAIEVLQPDENGVYNFIYENKVRLRIFENVADEELILFSDVLDFPLGTLGLEEMRKLLLSNFRWAFTAGGSFGVQPGTDLVEYALHISLQKMELDQFELLLKEVIAAILNCRRNLTGSDNLSVQIRAKQSLDPQLLKG